MTFSTLNIIDKNGLILSFAPEPLQSKFPPCPDITYLLSVVKESIILNVNNNVYNV